MDKIVDFTRDKVTVNINFRRDMITAASVLKSWQVSDFKDEIKANQVALSKAQDKDEQIRLNKQYHSLLSQLQERVREWVDGLESGAIAVELRQQYVAVNEYMRVLTAGNKYNLMGTPEEMIRTILIRQAKKQLVRVTNQLFKLEKHHFERMDYVEAYLEGVDLQNETLRYDDQLIRQEQFNFYSIYGDQQERSTLLKALDVIAYFRGRPCLLKVANRGHDEVPLNRHNHFHLIDLLSVHEPAVTEQRSPFFVTSLVLPFFKEIEGKYSPVIPSRQVAHPEVLHLYHQALQEINPVKHFLAISEIYEYALAHQQHCTNGFPSYLQEVWNTVEKGAEGAYIIQYFYQKALEADLLPIYYLDSGLAYDAEKNEFHMVREQSYKDVITELKKLSQKIIADWEQQEGRPVQEFYQALVDGEYYRQSTQAKEQHFGRSYEVENLFMELVARYIIERLNPHLQDFAYTQKEIVCPVM